MMIKKGPRRLKLIMTTTTRTAEITVEAKVPIKQLSKTIKAIMGELEKTNHNEPGKGKSGLST